MAPSINMKQFSVDLLNALHAPVTHQNVASLMGWQAAEGGAVHGNPFNTTEGGPRGTTVFNSVGVKSYPSYQAALHATVATLTGSNASTAGYNSIIGALRSSNPSAFISAVGNSQWGTGGALLSETVNSALGQNFGIKPSGAIKGVAKGHAQGPQPNVPKPQTKTTSQTITDPGVTTKTTSGGGLDVKSAILNALMTPTAINTTTGTPSASSSLLTKLMANISSGAYTTPVVNTISKSAGQSATITNTNRTVAQAKAGGGKPAKGGAPGQSTSGAAYVSPFGKAAVNWERVDMGQDASVAPGTAIYSIGDAKITSITPDWFQGQPLIETQLLSGPRKGQYVYYAEGITTHHKAGDIVKAGEQIATTTSQPTGLEFGFGANPGGTTLAQGTTGYTEGEVTPAGTAFAKFIRGLPTS